MKYETQEDHGMRSRVWLEIAMPGNSSWIPYAPQGVTGLHDDDDDYDYDKYKLASLTKPSGIL
jgi:hypothetical protein